MTIDVGGKLIGPEEPCFIIAEVAQAHEGSLGIAHSYIDAVAKSGVDAVKFQTHIAAEESSIDEPFRVKFSYEDSTRYAYWERMEFTEQQWKGLADHCNDVGLIFLSSPFSTKAIKLLEKIEMPAWKVGSGEVNNSRALELMIDTHRPILLSSGMSDWGEITESVEKIKKTKTPVALFQCTSKYPTEYSDVGLNVIDEMRKRYSIPIGLSDHSGSKSPAMAAIAKGVDLLELHVVFDRDMFGPDSKSSVTCSELAEIVNFRDDCHLMDTHPVNKDEMANDLLEMKRLFNKSVVLVETVKKGSFLRSDALTLKKPGTGLPADALARCVGKRVNKDLEQGHILKWKDLDDGFE